MKRLFAVLALVALAACGGDSATNPSASIAGSYSLRTVNGSPMPYTLSSSSTYTAVVTSDVITMRDDGTWSEVFSYRETSNGVTTNGVENESGTWTRSGDNLTLNSSGQVLFTGTVSGSSLNLSAGGYALVYTK